MKNSILKSLVILALFIGGSLHAQKAEVIKLNQTPGAFETTELMLEPGTYIFEVSNEGVDHEVGFVIAPEGKTEMSDHLKEAYVQEMIKDGKSSTSKEVTLAAGEYVYFCPMNPTPQYKLTVK